MALGGMPPAGPGGMPQAEGAVGIDQDTAELLVTEFVGLERFIM